VSIRYGQLAYTSLDKPGSIGGWQTKQVTGALSAAEAQTLVAGVRTALDPVDPLPTYPSHEKLERAPHRLAYRRIDARRAAYWHTVPAGADGTGRPGNVFAHVVLDRDPEAPPRHRPIQWWRSPQWMCPYGSAAVASAVLPDDPPGPAEAVTKDSVVAFALDTSTWRLATLFGLLDAVGAALDGGAPVVLGVESPDAAAQWIGLVSFLMSPGTAARLNFSTFDRADQVGLAVQSTQHLTAVPAVDLPGLPPGVVVIDETAILSLGELGGEPHRTATGQPIVVTPWSAMAQVVLLEPRSARAVLDDIDRYAAQIEDSALPPAWPMAMAVAAAPEYADAHAEAHMVIAAHTPRGVAPGSAVGATISGVMTALVGFSTADAWHAVQHAPPGPASDHADLTYLRRAIADDTWLNQLGPIPVGPRRFQRTSVPAELSAAVGPALEQARGVGPDQVVRLVDFLMRAGVDDEQLSAALSRDVVASLCDPKSGPRLTHRLGQRIGTEVRLALAAESLNVTGHRDGLTELSDEVLDWLAEGITAPAPSELTQAHPGNATWNRAVLRGARAQHLGPADAADRCAWLWWLRICGSQRFEQAVAAGVWEPVELLAAAGGAPPGLSVLPTLLGVPDSAALAALASAVLEAYAEDTVAACAAIRLFEPRIWVQKGFIETYLATYSPHLDAALQVLGPDRLHPDFAVRLLTLAVAATLAGQPYPAGCEALAADSVLATPAVAQVVALVDDHIINPAVVLAASLVRTAAEEESGPSALSVDYLLAQVAHQIAASRDLTDQEIDDAAELMAKMSGVEPEGSALRRNRKLVTKLLARRAEASRSVADRIRRNR
jgi:GTPase-associated protein 1, N-terminal domain type 2/GTPase-associated protein 1, middle domain